MRLKQQTAGAYHKTKYTDLKDMDAMPSPMAKDTLRKILNNGYGLMDGYAVLEIVKLLKTLREMNLEFTLKTYETQEFNDGKNKYRGLYYEFTTVFFEDDRPEK